MMRSFTLSRPRALSRRLRSAVSRDISISLDIIFSSFLRSDQIRSVPRSLIHFGGRQRRQQVAGVICLYYMHFAKALPMEEGRRKLPPVRRRPSVPDRQMIKLPSFLLILPSAFAYTILFRHNIAQTDSLLQSSARRLFSLSIYAAAYNSAPLSLPSLGNKNLKPLTLKRAHSLMGPWETLVVGKTPRDTK